MTNNLTNYSVVRYITLCTVSQWSNNCITYFCLHLTLHIILDLSLNNKHKTFKRLENIRNRV